MMSVATHLAQQGFSIPSQRALAMVDYENLPPGSASVSTYIFP